MAGAAGCNDRAAAVHADLREPARVEAVEAEQLLEFRGHWASWSPRRAAEGLPVILRRYREAMPPGSYFAVSHRRRPAGGREVQDARVPRGRHGDDEPHRSITYVAVGRRTRWAGLGILPTRVPKWCLTARFVVRGVLASWHGLPKRAPGR